MTIIRGKALYIIALIAISSWAISSCSKVKPESVEIVEKEKTILLYMSAHNNLYPDACDNTLRILNGYIPDDNCNLLIYSLNLDLNNYRIKDTLPLLVHIFKDKNNQVVADTVYRFPYQNSSTKTALGRTLNVVKTLFPAKEYGLILWSHGTGWLPEGYFNSDNGDDDGIYDSAPSPWPAPPGGIDPYAHLVKSFGSERDREMSIFDISESLPMQFEFIAFDACLMGCIEIAYELRDKCNYIIFSPAEILTDSFDYSKVIEDMFNGDYAKVSLDTYNYYNNQSGDLQSVTMSTLKTDGLEDVAAIANSIFDKYRDKISTLDMTSIQPYFRYNKHWFYDLNDFISQLASASEAEQFKSALEKVVIAKYTTGKMINLHIDKNKYSGVSTYINNPSNSYLDSYYKKFAWEQAVQMTKEAEDEE